MDGGVVTIITLVATNIGVVAYKFGRLTQKTDDLCRRVGKMERAVNNKLKKEK